MKQIRGWSVIPTKVQTMFNDNFFDRARRIWKVCCYDRFNIINDYNPYNIYPQFDELPKHDLRDCSLENIMLNQAEKFANDSPNNICIAWSGGVDSTGIICSLILVGYPIEKLTIVCTEQSIKEYKLFYEYLLKNKARIVINNKRNDEVIDAYKKVECDTILLGWGADQLYHFYEVYNWRDFANIDWKDALKTNYEQWGLSDNIDQDISIYQYYVDKLDWRLKSYFDLCLLGNLSLKLTELRYWFACEAQDEKIAQKTFLFYDSARFTNWSYMHQDITRSYFEQNDNRLYKPEIKNVIYQVIKDKNYLYNKGKEPSWGRQYDKNKPIRHFKLVLYDNEGFKCYDHKLSTIKGPYYLQQDCVNLFKHYMKGYLKDNAAN